MGNTPVETMDPVVGNGIFPIYLFIASVANAVWLWHASGDLGERGGSRALFSLALANLLWVVPCWLQCLAKWISGPGDYWWIVDAPSYSTGCDLMAFYSLFASISGLILGAMIAHMSYSSRCKGEPLSKDTIHQWIIAAFVMAFVQCMLPVIGVGSYKYSGEGYCYIDWSDTAQAVCLELVLYPMFGLTMYWFIQCALHPATEDSDFQPWWWVLALSCFSAWIGWVPAIFIGLGSDTPYPDSFPSGYMITVGAFAHFQPLINPYLYGVKWKEWYDSADMLIDSCTKIVPVSDIEACDKAPASEMGAVEVAALPSSPSERGCCQ